MTLFGTFPKEEYYAIDTTRLLFGFVQRPVAQETEGDIGVLNRIHETTCLSRERLRNVNRVDDYLLKEHESGTPQDHSARRQS